jgi:hypothetical protein
LEQFKDIIDIITLDELPEEYITKIIENDFSGNEQKKTLFYDKIMKNSNLKTLIKNPLNLKVVCGLVYHDKINDTATLPEIYEKIVEKRLSWEDEKPSRKLTFKTEDSEEEKEGMETFLQQRKEFLSELAYQIIFE